MRQAGFKSTHNTRILSTLPNLPDKVRDVTLFIPELFWPHGRSGGTPPPAHALQALIARGNAAEAYCEHEQSWLCQQFGVVRQNDWPSAPIELSGAGEFPGGDFCMSADPVHLQVNRDQLILLAPQTLSITADEADCLCTDLSRHFADDGLTFLAPEPRRWYVRSGNVARIRTSALSRVIGTNVDRSLPQGDDALAWHGVFNEVQMLLHSHPVNEAREQRGALPLNSLWFSGGGTLPRVSASFDALIGTGALALGLARLSEIPVVAPDRGIAALDAARKHVLIELLDAQSPALLRDFDGWRNAIAYLEQVWFAPLERMLRKGDIRQIAVATVTGERARRWTTIRRNLWRWWRPLPTLIQAAGIQS